jgi:hypothetical protein
VDLEVVRRERRVPTWKVSTVEEEVSMAVVEAMFAVWRVRDEAKVCCRC